MRTFTLPQRTALMSTFFTAVATMSCLATVLALTSCQRGGVRSPAPVPAANTQDEQAAQDAREKAEVARSIDQLVPGSPITIGTGADAKTCTAGWVVAMSGEFDGRMGILTAGRCAPNKAEVHVLYVPRGKSAVVDGMTNVLIGHVVAGGPLHNVPGDPDVSIIWVETQPSEFGSLGVLPNGQVRISEEVANDASSWIDKYGAPRLCWGYSATRPELSVSRVGCGTARTTTANNSFIVRPEDVARAVPEILGAPVWTESRDKKIAGIVTSVENGNVVVTTINKLVKRIPATICLDVTSSGQGCATRPMTEPN
ncbi:MAG: hypothetical protein ACRC20_12350 [Segniliparus sp.]|uniref:hypothetical protein n=1 Tax=Segniliparus sp. TaxID=2804064 RepID=UPI003F3F028F